MNIIHRFISNISRRFFTWLWEDFIKPTVWVSCVSLLVLSIFCAISYVIGLIAVWIDPEMVVHVKDDAFINDTLGVGFMLLILMSMLTLVACCGGSLVYKFIIEVKDGIVHSYRESLKG